MNAASASTLEKKLCEESYRKLSAVDNPELHTFVAKYVELCNPKSVFVCTDAREDIQYIKQQALNKGEVKKISLEGKAVHFDGYRDQGRDRKNTRLLVSKGIELGPLLETADRKAGLDEIHGILDNNMKDHEMYVCFFCLGPRNSEFSIPCVQLTDSSYVVQSEHLLYRTGYEEFKRLGRKAKFFKFVHSQGELENGVSKNVDKRRIYVDVEGEAVYSTNTQYGGNSIGLKKLAMRLAIARASREGWLTEHMFIIGVRGPKERKTYFTGAFPSFCGKTSTAMLEGETVVGDDIAYLRRCKNGVRAVNAEKGVFGIIHEINSKDDPVIWRALHSPNEVIFSNVLVTLTGDVYWIGKDGKTPLGGANYSGEWTPGKKDSEGSEIAPSHKNARFTIELAALENADSNVENPEGVLVGGIIYGGRDSNTWVPVEEAFDWKHGVITKGAALESETTAAVLGKEGVREFNPMSNLDFLSISVGKYVKNHLSFGEGLRNPPKIFSVNYFLKDSNNRFLNEKKDKAVWLKWMELRSHNEAKAVKTPTGFIPTYEDLEKMFGKVLGKDYCEGDYVKQFTLRIPENLAKIDRVLDIYRSKVPDAPAEVFEVLGEQKRRLEEARKKYGDYVSPNKF